MMEHLVQSGSRLDEVCIVLMCEPEVIGKLLRNRMTADWQASEVKVIRGEASHCSQLEIQYDPAKVFRFGFSATEYFQAAFLRPA